MFWQTEQSVIGTNPLTLVRIVIAGGQDRPCLKQTSVEKQLTITFVKVALVMTNKME